MAAWPSPGCSGADRGPRPHASPTSCGRRRSAERCCWSPPSPRIIAANVGDDYASLRDTAFGPDALHLHLTFGQWASDGLLAIFFFVAGLELKREFVAGDLREPSRAVLPVVAAVGGMAVPALVFVLVNLGGSLDGWAIPDGDRHRVRARRAGRHRESPPVGAADVPVDARRGRRPPGDHHHRGRLHQDPAHRVPPAGGHSARDLHSPGAAPRTFVVAPAPSRGSRLGPRPCVGGARHGCRRAARLRRAGDPARRQQRHRPRRALRAPVPAAVGRGRGAGVRVLQRRRRDRRVVGIHRCADRAASRSGSSPACSSARPSASSGRPGSSPGSPAPSSTTTWSGSTSSASRCSPGWDSRSRC